MWYAELTRGKERRALMGTLWDLNKILSSVKEKTFKWLSGWVCQEQYPKHHGTTLRSRHGRWSRAQPTTHFSSKCQSSGGAGMHGPLARSLIHLKYKLRGCDGRGSLRDSVFEKGKLGHHLHLIILESISHLLLPYCWLCLGSNVKCHRMSVLNNRHLFANSSGDWGIQTQSCSHSFSEDRSPPAMQTAVFLLSLHMEHVQ